MVNAQEWLDKEYPLEKRWGITKLDINWKNLTGELKISGFSNLTRLYCSNNQLTKLELNDCVNLTRLDYSYNQLTKLELNECVNLTELHCSNNQLTKLELNDCVNLTRLYCSNNQLTKLELNDCVNLTELHCSNNQLTNLDFLPKLNPTKLTLLQIFNNNFSTSDCSVFSHLVNLESLLIGSDNLEWINQGIYNCFIGSLATLQNLTKLEELDIKNTDLINSGLEYLPDSLKEFYCSTKERPTALSQQLINQLIVYGEPEKDFNGDNYVHLLTIRKAWKQQGFSEQETKQWIDAGVKIDDYGFVTWLRDVKKETSKWITNYKEDYQLLSERFKKYGLCSECSQPNTGEQWCRTCNTSRLQQYFNKWTSHNAKVDEFIQKHQLQATDANKFIEWISYEQFTKIEYLAEGGFGKVYKANWMTGNIHHWDRESKQWQREKDEDKDYYEDDKNESEYIYYDDEWDDDKWSEKDNNDHEKNKKHKNYREVVLKILTNSQNNTDFLQETANHKIIDDWFNNIVPCYGLSQNHDGNYLMVMQYMPEGNLRQYLSKNNKKLTLQDKFNQLVNISRGLKDLHQKNLVHHDFHSGNILKGIEKTSCLITDLGLCKPVGETNQEKVFGVLPYVAPEVLQSQPYTQASDIYSFGIIAYELFSGLPPYYDRVHDVNLGVKICHGLRPQFQIKIPKLLKDLINQCWNADSKKRPTAHELERTLRSWEQRNEKFENQLQKAEKHNKTLSDKVKFPNYKIHRGAVYHSKLLPTKEITQLMQNFNNFQTKALELNTQLIKAKELAKEITMQQKYNDFKKVLKLVLEKSEELETIITINQIAISEEMKEVLTKIKELKIKSQKKDGIYQELAKKKLAKENELKELKKITIVENNLEEDELEDILEAQAEFIKTNDSKRLERTKKKLIKTISEVEINNLCQLQIKITQLELKLNQNIDQSARQLTQIINNINIQQGHAIINSQLGNDTNLSQNTNNNVQVGDISIEHSQFVGSVAIGVGELNTTNQTKLVKIEEEFQTQIQTPPKN